MYTLILENGNVVRNSDNVVVAPCSDTTTKDYTDYKKWLDDGNEPESIHFPEDFETVNNIEKYIYKDQSFSINIEYLKELKMIELKEQFSEQFKSGLLNSSLGFTVENRRYNDKNDKDNVDMLISLNVTEYKDSSGDYHDVTKEELQLLKDEMQQQLMGYYQTKWDFENAIKLATSEADIANINIVF